MIRRVTPDDTQFFVSAIDILNRTQGRDLFAADYLDLRTADANCIVVGAFAENRIVGLGVAELIHDYDYYKPFDSEIESTLDSLKVGSFSTLAITEELQGKGIGYQISQERLSWLRKWERDIVLGVSWVSGRAHTSDRLFERLGFQAVNRVEDFYYKSSIEKPFICPGCGEPPCTCAAILYRLLLS